MEKKPTSEQFGNYQKLFDYFNEQLFGGELPPCLLNLSRKGKRNAGHFSYQRWVSKEGIKAHEININPLYLSRATDIDVCQTIVHEMVHLWQYEFGKTSRPGYHNMQWANKMESIGLMPSSTGQIGGRRLGQGMSDYPIKGGLFMQAFEAMPKALLLPFRSLEIRLAVLGEGGKPKSKNRNKTKYTCLGCGTNVWGKPDLKIVCGTCEDYFQVAS